MNSKLSRREQRLLDILPAALILAAYSFLIALPMQQRLQSKIKHLRVSQKTSVDQRAADQSLQQLTTAQMNLERLKERMARDRQKIIERSQSWRKPEDQLQTVHLLTSMLGDYNLSIVSQEFEVNPKLSNYFQEITEVINSYSPQAPPLEFWKIQLEGEYNDVRKFLGTIDIDTMCTFPVAITMTASGLNDGLHKWTILFVV